MIISFLEIFTEYISIILCIHKAAGKRIRLNWWSLFDFVCWLMLIFMGEKIVFGKLLPYVYLFVYTRIRVADTWKKTVKPFCIMMCTIPMLQLLIYSIIGDIMVRLNVFNVYLVAIIVNVLIVIFLFLWKKKYLFVLMDAVTKFRRFIFFILLIFLFIYLISYFLEYKEVKSYFIDQLIICFLIVALMFILWINSENEKRHKAEELRTYQLYTSTFEEAVAAIRMKQHEFDNHINAIKCMQYTIHDAKKLIDEQNKYCEKILQDNKYNKLLKLNTSPILIGYLYSKFTAAAAQDIDIEYEIQDIHIEQLAINDLIEIIGILLDNAVESLECQSDKEIEIKLFEENSKFIISIANRSEKKTNSELEKFFEYGYSTKGKGRGVGLHRMNALLKKYNANLKVENIEKYDANYLCFQIIF